MQATSATPPIVVHTGPVVVHPVVGQSSDVLTLVIAALGVLLALASLAWQAWSFARSGSRVTVFLARGLSDGGAVLTMPADATPQ